MNRTPLKDVKESTIFLYSDIECKIIGEYAEGYFIIAPVDKKENIIFAKNYGFWENKPSTEHEIRGAIKNSKTTGTHPLYYAIAGSDVVEILNSSDMRERSDEFLEVKEVPDDKNYLFPSIESL